MHIDPSCEKVVFGSIRLAGVASLRPPHVPKLRTGSRWSLILRPNVNGKLQVCPLQSLKNAPVNGFPVNCMLAATGARILLLGRFDLEIDKTCTGLSVSVFLSLPLCLCLSLCLWLSVWLCLSVCVCLSVSLSLSHWVCQSLSLRYISLSLSLSVLRCGMTLCGSVTGHLSVCLLCLSQSLQTRSTVRSVSVSSLAAYALNLG